MTKIIRVIILCFLCALLLFSAACEKAVSGEAGYTNEELGQEVLAFIPQEIQPIEANPYMLPMKVPPESGLHQLSVEKPQIDETLDTDEIVSAVLGSAVQAGKLHASDLEHSIHIETWDMQAATEIASENDDYINVSFQQQGYDFCSRIGIENISEYVDGMQDSPNSAVLLKYRSHGNFENWRVLFQNSPVFACTGMSKKSNDSFSSWNDQYGYDLYTIEQEYRNTFQMVDNEWYYSLAAMDKSLGYRFITWQENDPANHIFYACDLSEIHKSDDNVQGPFLWVGIDFCTLEKEFSFDFQSLTVYSFENFNDIESVYLHDDQKEYQYANDDEKYQLAVALFNQEDYYNAYLLLKELGGYDASETYLAECERLLQTIEINNASAVGKIKKTMKDCGMPIYDCLYVYQAEKLESLDLSDCSITELGFVSKFVNLKELSLDGNGISDLTPIKDLYALEYLSLAKNNISDTLPLYHLTNLQYLDLSCNLIEDVKGLAGLISLNELNLSTNNIATIAGLYNLENLESVDLSYNYISSVSALGNSPIKELNILNTDIDNLGAVAGFAYLEELTAGFWYIWQGNTDSYLMTKKYEKESHFFLGLSGLEFLCDHKNLKKLDLVKLQAQTLEPLATMPKLESLTLNQYSGPTQPEVMSKLVNLKELCGSFDGISFLPNLVNLEKFTLLAFSYVEDISLISELKNLKELIMFRYTDSLDFITELENLKFLKLIGLEGYPPWEIDDYSPLLELKNIEYLFLDNMKIDDLSIISQIETLKHLGIYGLTGISSIEGVQNLKNLEYFKLEGERVIGDYSPEKFDVSFFYGLENLTYVKVRAGNGDNNVDVRLYDANIQKEYHEYPLGDRVFLREMYDTGNLERLNALADYNSLQDFFIWTSDMQDGGVTKLTIPENVRNLHISSGKDTPVKLELDCADHKGLERVVIGCINLSEGGRNPFGEGTFVLEDLDFLEGCTNLKEIYIDSAAVKDISGLAGCDKLEIVHLQGNNITDITALTGKTYLKELDLSGNNIESIDALENCIRLQTVNLD